MTIAQNKAYDRVKAAAIRRNRAASRAARDIGNIPPVKDPARRMAADENFLTYCKVYFPHRFHLAFSDDHRRAAEKIQTAVDFGGLFAFAMPRGRGKTTYCEVAGLWSVTTGRVSFAMLIGATQPAAVSMLANMKKELLHNEALAEDWPEICYPIRQTEGEARQTGGQLHHGEKTSIIWTTDVITMPTIPGSQASGGVIRTAGLLGNIRGAHYITPAGRSLRPQLAIIDDPQTDQSANSPTQCAEREKTIQGAILGLAGPGQRMTALLPCTIIKPNDLAARMLDKDLHADWQGERFQQLKSFPTDMTFWEQYDQVRREDLANDLVNTPNAHGLYNDNRKRADAGALVDWPEAVEPGDASALETTMRQYLADPYAFACERQSDPPSDEPRAEDFKTPAEIATSIGATARGEVPEYAEKLVVAIDVQKQLLYYGVAAVGANFTGTLVDYGAWPDQGRTYYTLQRAHPTLATEYPGRYEARLFAALSDLLDHLAGRAWKRADGGNAYVDRVLIDANWKESTETIYQFCRRSKFASILTPCHGRYYSAASRGINGKKKKTGDIVGLQWRSPAVSKTQQSRYVAYDANYWKTFLQYRVAQVEEDPGNWRLYKARPNRHRMLSDHWTAERAVEIEADGRHVVEWRLPPNKPDNHLFDVATMLCVAASTQGCALPEHRRHVTRSKPKRKRKSTDL